MTTPFHAGADIRRHALYIDATSAARHPDRSVPARAGGHTHTAPLGTPRPSLLPSEATARDLVETGVSVFQDAVPADLCRALRADADARAEAGDFRAARIGSGPNLHLAPAVRSDRILWWQDDALSDAQRAWTGALEDLRLALNAATFMGLFEWEGHYAIYPPGTFYRPHVDVFAHAPERVVSTILYMNDDWDDDDGGLLRIYPGSGPDGRDPERHVDVPPRIGTFVAFESARLLHEVTTAHRERHSVSGWFRVRPLSDRAPRA